MKKLKGLQMSNHNYYHYCTSAMWNGGMAKNMQRNSENLVSFSFLDRNQSVKIFTKAWNFMTLDSITFM